MFDAIITDDAGKRVPLVRFNMIMLPIPWGPLPVAVQRELRAISWQGQWDMKSHFTRQGLVRNAPGLVFAMVPATFFLATRKTTSMWKYVDSPWFFPTFMAAWVIIIYAFARVFGMTSMTDTVRRDIARKALHLGHCASCGYLLPPNLVPADALTTCSECGASWKREPVPAATP